MRRYRLSKEADADLEGIYDYTYEQWGEEQAASYLQKLQEAFEQLCDYPAMGKHRMDIGQEYFGFTKEHHLIIYRMENAGIRVIRVLHKRMNVKMHMETAPS